MSADETNWVRCGCCGKDVRDTPEENTHHGLVPYPDDVGYGQCVGCGGDAAVKVVDEASARRRMGWGMVAVVEARIPIVAKHLNAANRARFEAMPFVKKVNVVLGLMRKGVIV